MNKNERLEDFAAVGRVVHRLQVSEVLARLIGRGVGVGTGTTFAVASHSVVLVGRAAASRKTHRGM